VNADRLKICTDKDERAMHLFDDIMLSPGLISKLDGVPSGFLKPKQRSGRTVVVWKGEDKGGSVCLPLNHSLFQLFDFKSIKKEIQ
jgi:hypothetical protein